MKTMLMICGFVINGMYATAQNDNFQQLEKLKNNLQLFAGFIESGKYKDIGNLILNDPGVYNELWGKVYNGIRDKENRPAFKNLKIDFKTFQDDEKNRTSLGFAYHWDYDINSKAFSGESRSGFNSRINLDGNVAFKKNLNPLDFQEAKIELGRFGFMGGTVNKLDSNLAARLNGIRVQLAEIEDEKELANSPLWNDLTEAMNIKNHYHYNLFAAAGWEGSQDFSKSQLTYGLQFRFSAKAYSDKKMLAQLNFLDYPFALIRFLTGTDKTVTPYGATLPVLTVGIDVVKPTDDTLRNKLKGNLDQYARFRFEAGFRTLVADVVNVPIHFNAAFRFFSEINAPTIVKDASLHRYAYFTCSLTGNNIYFASFSYGNLPFDRIANAVYAIGFKLNL